MDDEGLKTAAIEISRPKKEDLETVFGFWRAQHELHYNLDTTYYKPNSSELDKLAREYFEKVIDTDSPHILVARLSNRIVGFITFNEKRAGSGIETFASNLADHVEVIDLFIDEEFRGKNVGTQLMTKVQEHCQRAGLPNMKVEVATANTKALQFYEKLGFVPRQTEIFTTIKT